MKKMICMMGLIALTSCGHFGGQCNKSGTQCDMKAKAACQCGKENCTKCAQANGHAQCPMQNAAAAEAPKK